MLKMTIWTTISFRIGHLKQRGKRLYIKNITNVLFRFGLE